MAGAKPATGGIATRPTTAITKPTQPLDKIKPVAPAVGIKKPAGKDDDSDDPIAQSLAQRMKAGTITSVVSTADPKKSGAGVKPTAVTARDTIKPADKPTRPQTAVLPKSVEEKKVPAPVAKIEPKKLTATKPAGKDEEDPIEKSLAERVKAGGVSAVIGEKKVPAAPKTQPAKPTETKPAPSKVDKLAEKPAKPVEEKKVAAPSAPAKKDPIADKKAPATAAGGPIVMKGKKKDEVSHVQIEDSQEEKHDEAKIQEPIHEKVKEEVHVMEQQKEAPVQEKVHVDNSPAKAEPVSAPIEEPVHVEASVIEEAQPEPEEVHQEIVRDKEIEAPVEPEV